MSYQIKSLDELKYTEKYNKSLTRKYSGCMDSQFHGLYFNISDGNMVLHMINTISRNRDIDQNACLYIEELIHTKVKKELIKGKYSCRSVSEMLNGLLDQIEK